MITRIDLDTFKCFEILRLPLGKLTLLSGANASGKSSVLQALALLNQTLTENEWSTSLILNGVLVQLGTVLDVVDQVNARTKCGIGLVEDDIQELKWFFTGDRRDLSMKIERVITPWIDTVEVTEYDPSLHYMIPQRIDSPDRVDQMDWPPNMMWSLRTMTYISAERSGPRQIYEVFDPLTNPTVGPTGEYAVSVLHAKRDDGPLPSLVLPNETVSTLRQTEARMRTFFPGCELDIQEVEHANVVTLGVRTSRETSFFRPIHTGFGLTQILPIIVAAMTASEGSILLVENPEIHLHPAGQALMGQFMTEVAAAGVQVILETHSDHVLNGVRRAVKAGELPPEDVAIHFFRPRSEGEPQVISPTLDPTGNIDHWPDGFFDQFDKDMNHFAGWE